MTRSEVGQKAGLSEINKLVDAREGVINGTRVIDHRTPESLLVSFAKAMEGRSLSSRLFSFSNVDSQTDKRRFRGLKFSFSDRSDTIHQFRVSAHKDPAGYHIAEFYKSELPAELVTNGFVEVNLDGRPGNIHHVYTTPDTGNPAMVAEQERAWLQDALAQYQSNPKAWHLLYSVANNGRTKVDVTQGKLHYVTELQKIDNHYPLYRTRDAMPRIRLYEGVDDLYRKITEDPTHFMTDPYARFCN